MAPDIKKETVSFPDWWNIHLYDYLKTMPLRGWVWEFMRRERLKNVLGVSPVNAMAPHRSNAEIQGPARLLYLTWENYYRSHEPVFIPPAVWHGKRSQLIYGALHRIDGYELEDYSWVWDHIPRKEIDLTIDLRRKDEVLISDFRTCLERLRKDHGRSKETCCPRTSAWVSSNMLQIWDLKDYGIATSKIAELVITKCVNPLAKDKNAYKSAKISIDTKKWQKVALYCQAKEAGLRTKPTVKNGNSK